MLVVFGGLECFWGAFNEVSVNFVSFEGNSWGFAGCEFDWVGGI